MFNYLNFATTTTTTTSHFWSSVRLIPSCQYKYYFNLLKLLPYVSQWDIFLISTKSGQLLDVIQLFTVKFLFLEAFFFVK